MTIVIDTSLTDRLGTELRSGIQIINDAIAHFDKLASLPFALPFPPGSHTGRRQRSQVQRALAETFHRLLVLRASELSSASVQSLNERKLVSFAIGARGVLETAIVAAYYLTKLESALATDPIDHKFVTQMLKTCVIGSRFDWHGFFHRPTDIVTFIEAYSRGAHQTDRNLATNIVTMSGALAARFEKVKPQSGGHIHFLYALLSDIAHPALGSHLVYFNTEGARSANREPAEGTLLVFCSWILPNYALACLALKDCLNELLGLARGFR